MIVGECQAFNLIVSAVEEIVHSELVRLIDTFRSTNRLQHRPNDDIWIDDG